MKTALPLLLILLAACSANTPDSRVAGSGAGFNDYIDYERQRFQREEALTRTEIASGGQISDEGVALEPVDVASAPVVTTDNPGISDENSFEAVSSRQTIQSDAERLAAQRQAYQVIEPTNLPNRPANERPNIVQYALGTHHPVGEKIWERPNSTSEARYNRACQRFPSPDLAQEEFLALGGPRKDPRGMDPDGDGYACLWDPTPFRAVQAAAKN